MKKLFLLTKRELKDKLNSARAQGCEEGYRKSQHDAVSNAINNMQKEMATLLGCMTVHGLTTSHGKVDGISFTEVEVPSSLFGKYKMKKAYNKEKDVYVYRVEV